VNSERERSRRHASSRWRWLRSRPDGCVEQRIRQ
jgi:hypothetical protein